MVFAEELLAFIRFYAPLGAVGMFRWTVWGLRKVIGRWYAPVPRNDYTATVSVVVPVYNEEPDVFRMALESWKANSPHEIIAAIDHSDEKCLSIFSEFQRACPTAKLVVMNVPGKRPALADGARHATGDIIAFIDSDTIWPQDILPDLLAPFIDPLVGGVGSRQGVWKADTLARKIFSIQLDTRYTDEFPFLSVVGDAFTCLSGRTALYRRSIVLTVLDGLLNETFAGQKCISGDDKCMTRLVQERGWKTRFQQNAVVYTTGAESFKTYLKQQIRWARNSWRSDLQSIRGEWIWRRDKILALHMLDRFVEPIFAMLGPVYLMVSILAQKWVGVAVLIAWWYVSRSLKIWGSLWNNPRYFALVPLYIPCVYLMNALKMYAFFSMNTQGWITRWDASRTSPLSALQRRFRQWSPAFAVMVTIILEFLIAAYYAGIV